MTRPLEWATLGTALGCGLLAGVFFAFSAFVMPALRRLPASQGIAAMQSINKLAAGADLEDPPGKAREQDAPAFGTADWAVQISHDDTVRAASARTAAAIRAGSGAARSGGRGPCRRSG
jgi:hypothetical protein